MIPLMLSDLSCANDSLAPPGNKARIKECQCEQCVPTDDVEGFLWTGLAVRKTIPDDNTGAR